MILNQIKKRRLALFFIVSRKKKIVYSFEIDSLNKFVKKQLVFFTKFSCKVFFNHFSTTKGAGIRIGKGKGSSLFFGFNLFIGTVVYSFNYVEKKKLLSFFFNQKSSFKGFIKQNFQVCKSEYSVMVTF